MHELIGAADGHTCLSKRLIPNMTFLIFLDRTPTLTLAKIHLECAPDFNAAQTSQDTIQHDERTSHLHTSDRITTPSPSIIGNTYVKRHVSAHDGHP